MIREWTFIVSVLDEDYDFARNRLALALGIGNDESFEIKDGYSDV